MRFSYEDADRYGSSGGKGSFFSLKDDGDTAQVHFLGDDMNDFPGYAVHKVPIGDGHRWVNCLREAGAPIEDCPFCAEKRNDPELAKVYAKLFIPLYNIDEDKVQIWERGKTFFRDLASHCAHNPKLSEVITEIERKGKAKDPSTTYGLYAMKEEDDFDIENVREDIPEILGDIVLDKTAEEMEYYLDHGEFPSESSEDERPARRGSKKEDERPKRESRRPTSRRRGAEEEY